MQNKIPRPEGARGVVLFYETLVSNVVQLIVSGSMDSKTKVGEREMMGKNGDEILMYPRISTTCIGKSIYVCVSCEKKRKFECRSMYCITCDCTVLRNLYS